MAKKKRTREHIIADLSANHVERFALLTGYTVQKFSSDYGYDLRIHTFNEAGEPEQGVIYIQLKATDHITVLKDGVTISFQTDKRDLELWLYEPMPVFLIVYDARNMEAYWLHVQEYFEGVDFESLPDHVTVRLTKHHLVDEWNVVRFREYKQIVLNKFWRCS